MKKQFLTFSLASVVVIFSGCATTTNQPHYIDHEKLGTSTPTTLGLDYEDFERTALKLINSMLKSPYLNKMYKIKNKKYKMPLILMISDFNIDTVQRIDIDQLIKKIRIALLNSGKFLVTTALRAGGPEDKATIELAKLRGENPDKIIKKLANRIDLTLSGKIFMKRSLLSNGEQRLDHYIQMSLTDNKTGIAFWEGEEVISKAGSNKSAPW